MIRTGIFYDKLTASKLPVYEMDTGKFYRLDICEPGAEGPFLIANKVLYSRVKRNKEYELGDSEVYKRFRYCIVGAQNINLKSQVDRTREHGAFVTRQVKVLNDEDYCEIFLYNGRRDKETYGFHGYRYISEVQSLASVSEIEPWNMSSYSAINLEKPNILTSDVEYIPYDTLKVMYKLDHIETRDYAVVHNNEEIDELKNYLLRRVRDAGYDTETDTLEWNMFSDSHLTGIVVSAAEHHSRYIPFGHTKFPNFDITIFFDFMRWCRDNNIILDAHNKKFEQKILLYFAYHNRLEDFDISIQRDSLITSVMNNPVIIKGAHSLKNLEELRTGLFYLELKHIFPGKIMFPVLDEVLTKIYACPDADSTVSVQENEIKKMLSTHPAMYSLYELECELADLKAEQEFFGMRVDEDATFESAQIVTKNRDIVKEHVFSILGEEVELDSPKVLANLFYERLRCKVYVRTKTNAPSTGSAALKKLASLKKSNPSAIVTQDIRNIDKDKKVDILLMKASELNEAQYPIMPLLLKYREYNKQITGFFDRIAKNKKGSRLMFSVNQNGTETGRQSSSIHQFAKSLRYILLADSVDHDFIAADYSQMELRLFFSKAKEESFVKLASVDGADLHRIIAAEIQGKEVWDISIEERSKDKNRNFGVVYLISGKGLALQKYGAGATDAQIEECNKSIESFYRKYRRCAELIRVTASDGEKNLYAKTLFGRIRKFDELADPELPRERRAALIRRLNNMPIQGTGADITKIAEVECRKWCKKKGWDKLVDTPNGRLQLVRVMVSVHDEILLSKHKSVPIEEVLEMLTTCMEIQVEEEGFKYAPLFIGVKVGTNWGDGKRDDLEMPRGLRMKLMEDYKRTGKSAIPNINAKEELLEIIQAYRESELISYMEDLIEKYGEDVETLWSVLRHPVLTHELIARFPQTKASIEHDGLYTHHERMRYGIRCYLEYRKDKELYKEIHKKEDTSKIIEEDYDTKLAMEEMLGLHSDVKYFDADGNITFEDSDEEEVDGVYVDEDILNIERMTSTHYSYIIELFDSIIVDTDHLTDDETNEVIQMIWTNRTPKGFSNVKLSRFDKLIALPMKCDVLANKTEIECYIQAKSLEKEALLRKSF